MATVVTLANPGWFQISISLISLQGQALKFLGAYSFGGKHRRVGLCCLHRYIDLLIIEWNAGSCSFSLSKWFVLFLVCMYLVDRSLFEGRSHQFF